MASDVDVVNLALTKLGARRITSLYDDVEEARTANAIYEMVRDAEIGRHNWSFAAKRVMMPTIAGEVPVSDFNHLYQIPEDCLCVVRVGDILPGSRRTNYVTREDSAYRLQGKRIESNIDPPLPLLYNARVTDSTAFDPLFIEMLACKLALEMCEKLTQSNTKKQAIAQQYRQAYFDAVTNDSIQEPPQPIADDSWMLARI